MSTKNEDFCVLCGSIRMTCSDPSYPSYKKPNDVPRFARHFAFKEFSPLKRGAWMRNSLKAKRL
jgi:hypothetical protein